MNILYVIRQRQRALLGIFLALSAAYLIYTLVFVREYSAYAQISDYNSRANNDAPQLGDNSPYLAPLRSDNLTKKIAAGLNDDDRRRLTAPFTHWLHWGPGRGPVEILLEGRQINAAAGMVDVGFQHPDPVIAANIANALADEFVSESNSSKEERMHQSLADIEAKTKAQRDKAADLRKQMDDLSVQYGVTNLDAGADTVMQSAMADLNKQAIQYKGLMDTLDLRQTQIKDQLAANKSLLDFDFIRSQPNIAQLYSNAQMQTNHVQELRTDGFQPESPAMTDAQALMSGAMRELNAALESYVNQVQADFKAASSNYEQAAKRLEDMQRKNQELSGARSIYDGLHKDLNTTNEMLSKLEVAASEAETKFNLSDPNFVVLARAEPPSVANAKPWAKIAFTSLGLGVGGSLLALLGFAMLRPPPKQEREEYERRRRRHRHFHSSRHRSSSESSKSSSSRHRH